MIVFLYAIQTQYILRTLHLFVLSIKRISLQNVTFFSMVRLVLFILRICNFCIDYDLTLTYVIYPNNVYVIYTKCTIIFWGPCCLVDHYRSIRVVSKYCLGLQSSWSFSSLKSHTKAQCTDVVTRRKQILVYLFIVIR